MSRFCKFGKLHVTKGNGDKLLDITATTNLTEAQPSKSRRNPSSGCYWGFILCLRDTLYLFLAIAIIAYALRQIKFTQLLYFLYVSLYFLRNFYFCVFYTFFFF